MHVAQHYVAFSILRNFIYLSLKYLSKYLLLEHPEPVLLSQGERPSYYYCCCCYYYYYYYYYYYTSDVERLWMCGRDSR